MCNLIPAAESELLSVNGLVDRAIAGPGETVTIRRDAVCDPAFLGFSGGSQVFLRFEPPGLGPSTEISIAGAALTVIPPGCNVVGDCLSFVIPDTDSLLPPAGDRQGFAGPARIFVRNGGVVEAEIGQLYSPVSNPAACTVRQEETLFGAFTVLPESNDFAALENGNATQILATLDGNGNLLIPFNYEDVLAAEPGAPIFRFLEGSADLPAFLSDPDPKPPIRLPSSTFLRSFTPTGRPIPPILKTDGIGEQVFGSVDGLESVLRFARRDPDDPVAQPIYDLTDRFFDSRGPIVIQNFVVAARAPAPLSGLTASTGLVVFARDERQENGDLNGDGDFFDRVVQLVDVSDGQPTNTLAGVVVLNTEGRSRVALGTSDTASALLLSESRNGFVDRNGDGDFFDSVLRVYRADGTELTGAMNPAVDPNPVVDGKPLVVSGDLVFFRSDESDDAQRVTERVSENAAGVGQDDSSISTFRPSLSRHGRFVVFDSIASNLVTPDSPNSRDVFVVDRGSSPTPTIERISEAFDGSGEGNGESRKASINADGSFVAFESLASNLTDDPNNGFRDVFIADRSLGTIELLSRGVGGGIANGPSEISPRSISADGCRVAFSSSASNLVNGDNNFATDAFVVDRCAGTIQRVATGLAEDLRLSISANGRFIVFQTSGALLPTRDFNATTDVYLFDLDTSTLERVSEGPGGVESFLVSADPAVSGDGRFVAFVSAGAIFVQNDTNSADDIFVVDRLLRDLCESIEPASERPNCRRRSIVRGNLGNGGTQTQNGLASGPSFSDDGRFIAFSALDEDLVPVVPGDVMGTSDVFVFDLLTLSIERASVSDSGTGGDAASEAAAISGDGRFVAFASSATNLTPDADDPAGVNDRFVRGVGLGSSLNGDVDLFDVVLQAFDAATSTLRPTARVPASLVATAAGRALILTPEESAGVNLNPASGDTDMADDVVQLYDGNADSLVSLGVAANRISLSDQIACLTVPEAAENETNLNGDLNGENGDDDIDDDVVAFWDVLSAPPSPTSIGIAADSIAAVGSRCVFTVPESAEGPLGTDLNGDQDVGDRVLHVFDPSATPSLINVGWAAEEFVAEGDLVAFRSCEANQGNTNLNGQNSPDSDTDDCVLQVLDLANPTAPINSGRAAIVCNFEACDPFFEPYRIRGATVSFAGLEEDQGAQDQNNDGDAVDTVIYVFNRVTFDPLADQIQVFGIGSPTDIPPFPTTVIDDSVLHLQVRESEIDADINGDGVIDDTLVVVIVGDTDEDQTLDFSESFGDNCVEFVNWAQIDANGDGVGDGCALPPVCGDGNVDPGELCDDQNVAAGDGCSPICTEEICGNGYVDIFEGCDDSNLTNGDGCNSSCQIEVPLDCGDGSIDGGEVCDTGGESAVCDFDCTLSVCGDALRNTSSGEMCDDGNVVAGDGCSRICTIELCGNFVVDVGEQCDDGNTSIGDGCDSACQSEISPFCGDGTLSIGEDCDDAGESLICDLDCTNVVCGDGVRNATSGEECDDSNIQDGDGCSGFCTVEICGNGIMDPGEGCDDSNTLEGDGCSSVCTVEICGNSIVDLGEECDDGNSQNGDGCSSLCANECLVFDTIDGGLGDPELVVNGSFEEPVISPGTFEVLPSIVGWTSSIGTGIELQSSCCGSPFDGAQHIELDSISSSNMYQDIPTGEGVCYRIEFAYSPRESRSAEDNALEVHWNGQLLATLSESGVGNSGTSWSLHAFNVVGAEGATRLEFIDVGPSNQFGGYVDRVSLVPEPSSTMLLMAGIIGLMGLHARVDRKNKLRFPHRRY